MDIKVLDAQSHYNNSIVVEKNDNYARSFSWGSNFPWFVLMNRVVFAPTMAYELSG
jgi:hypothetical protein